ncbi:MAG: type II secretion system major pseudopilin GspG [Terricaulis sp.]
MMSALKMFLARRRRSNAARVSEQGYTLLEVLIVLTIIALVATLVGPRLMAQLDRSKVTAARVQIRSLESSLETMRIDLGRYPDGGEGLGILVNRPGGQHDEDGVWQGPYLDSGLPKDPWGHDYVYVAPAAPGARPVIKSLGADGKEGGDGLNADITFGGE